MNTITALGSVQYDNRFDFLVCFSWFGVGCGKAGFALVLLLFC